MVKNLFETLEALAQTLDSVQNRSKSLAVIDKQMDNVSTQHTVVGIKYKLLDMTANKLDQANFLNAKILSETEDTDIAKAYMELSTQETAIQASLAAVARIMQQTLVDFLR